MYKKVKETSGLISLEKVKAPKKHIKSTLKFLNTVIPPASSDLDTKIFAFEIIDELIESSILEDVQAYLKKNDKSKLKEFDKFFKEVHKAIRSKAENHALYPMLILKLINFDFKCTSQKLQLNFDLANKAYQKTLDEYDPNVKCAKGANRNWLGFWSLIKTKNAEITGIFLSDTADRDTFMQNVFFYRNLKT